jgi:putative PIN family toxin of toxin-antitoxin system
VKVVLDTNVILAAFATRGLCEAVMAVCLDRHLLVLSEAILREVGKHLRGKFKLQPARVQELLTFLRQHAQFVEPADVAANACRDSDDRPILGTALAAQADMLVTGDKDLLSLRQFRNIPILSPREFYDRLR